MHRIAVWTVVGLLAVFSAWAGAPDTKKDTKGLSATEVAAAYLDAIP